MYDHDPDEVSLLGWDEFLARQWESIFVGYRTPTGLRKMCRRWSDLIEAGLSCSQEIADQLVRAEIVGRADRNLEGTAAAEALVRGMADVLASIRLDLLEMDEIPAEQRSGLLERHQRFYALICGFASGTEADGYRVAGE